MTKVETYRKKLRTLVSWEAYLLDESRLPGPRANLELAFAVALEASEEQLIRYAELDPDEAARDTKEEFLAVCGVIGLGYLAARHQGQHFDMLRRCASDPRWRIREAVALGLQKYGEDHFEKLLEMMVDWSRGSLLEKRAAIATLCEPKLLREEKNALRVMELLDSVTSSLLDESDRRNKDFRVLRKTLGYAWSVVVVVQPGDGKTRMEKWIRSKDKDLRWVMKNNLRKNRLIKMDPDWVEAKIRELSE
ncbi:MAG: hypothetical protein PVF85_08550 [Anaerolineales bacterium]|jgi:hypothetical protein